MAQVTVSVEADVATWASGIAAGAGSHLPIGNYGSADYRSAMRFPLPAGFAGFKSPITKAVLNFYISDFDHVAPRNSSILIRRMSTASMWTKAAGSTSCESGFSAGNNTQYGDITPVTGASQYTFDSGTTANAKKSVNVTGIVREYHDAGATKLVFVFDNASSGDYTELWADERSGYDATLVIDYEVVSGPDAPTQTAPAAGATSVTQTPTFDWNHVDPDGDPQVSAEVRLWNSTGGTLIDTFPVVGATSSLVCPINLGRGTTYQWDVRTADASGYGPYSAKRSVIIKAAPVTTITNTRFMEMSGGLPRLRVKWTCDQTQKKYRIQAGAYDSGWVTSTSQNVLLSTLALTNGTAVSVTVTVETTDGLQDADTRSFTPRWGLTVHRRDLTAAPVSWGTPSLLSTVPSGAQLVIEYGSNSTAGAAPTAWYSTLSSVPKARYVYWRAWFIPSATAGPQLDRITIPANFTVQTVDKWYSTLAGAAIVAPWGIDSGEYVYGSRSVLCENPGPVTAIFSGRIPVRAGRSYILTGLMKAEGNAGSDFSIYDPDALVIVEQDGVTVQSQRLTDTRDWFEASAYDVYRYKTPVWVAPADMDVVVRLRSAGVAGTSSWFDAIKLEESTVATPWSPGAIGAVVVDAGGIQIDGTKGGVFRARGSAGGVLDTMELGVRALKLGDTDLYAWASGEMHTPNNFHVTGTVKAGSNLTVAGLAAFSGPAYFVRGGIQTLVAATPIVADSSHVRIAAASNIVLSSVPTIAAGSPGQLLIIECGSTFTITLQDASVLVGSNLRMSTSTYVMGNRDTITFVYSSGSALWLETSRSNNL